MDRTEYMKSYRLANNDKYKAYRKVWREKHKDDPEQKAKQAQYSKTYYLRKLSTKANVSKNEDVNLTMSVGDSSG